MPRYTDAQKTHALETAQTEGVPAAAEATGIHPHTLRTWAKKANLTLPVRPDRQRTAEAAVIVGREVAEAARALRMSSAQERLAGLVTTAGDLTAEAVGVAGDTVSELRRVELEAIGLSQRVRDLADDDGGMADAVVARDEAWRRVRALSDTLKVQAQAYGIAVDKLAKLGGEDSPVPPAPTGPAGPMLQVPIGELLRDPEWRQQVTSTLAERINAKRTIEIETTATEGPTDGD